MKNRPQTHTRIAHKHTHTDCTKHTHGLHTNTHILLLIVVFALKTGTKRHTYLERKSFFFGGGLPQQKIFSPFLGTPGAPDTVKYDTFGARAHFHKKTHTRIGPGVVSALF